MSWIKEINYANATGVLKLAYDRIKGQDNVIDNVLTVHSLRPHTLTGHMTLYKNVLHHAENTLPKWYLETLGVYTSRLNKCEYCVAHHSEGVKKQLKDPKKSKSILDALERDAPQDFFSGKELKGLNYAKKLTLAPNEISENDIIALRKSGLTDGEILEINQVVAYFCYANRTVLGLGVSLEGDVLGLSPGDGTNPDNWSHV